MKDIESLNSLIDHFVKSGIFENNPFTLIDIGCSGGINKYWRYFGNNLNAYGIDPVLSEIQRLKKQETNKNIKYIAGYIGLPPDHPVIISRESKGPWGYIPSNRLSSNWAAELMAQKKDSEEKKMEQNRWPETFLADKSSRFSLVELVSKHNLDSVDFIKIDVDGEDYYALLSGEEIIDSHQVLGMMLEVNFFGTDCETDNTFHNTDRLMRKYGFELCDLSIRRYSKKAMPSRFLINMPAQTEFGVPFQGDALYVRDIVREKGDGNYHGFPIDKLCKLIVIYDIHGLPDCAAEVVLEFVNELSNHNIDVDLILDLLTPKFINKNLSYREYISLYEKDVNKFMPGLKNKYIEKLLNKYFI